MSFTACLSFSRYHRDMGRFLFQMLIETENYCLKSRQIKDAVVLRSLGSIGMLRPSPKAFVYAIATLL